ncbi:hypothetical protein LJC61_09780 [Ruminococcaceae bacterium OttesenSCG-928-A16]|nr:hypothetical protein [Ruminococcaceae bacterium OttesenSCG-928-A16]
MGKNAKHAQNPARQTALPACCGPVLVAKQQNPSYCKPLWLLAGGLAGLFYHAIQQKASTPPMLTGYKIVAIYKVHRHLSPWRVAFMFIKIELHFPMAEHSAFVLQKAATYIWLFRPKNLFVLKHHHLFFYFVPPKGRGVLPGKAKGCPAGL